LLLAEPARRRVAVGTEYQEAAGMPAPQPASRYISQPASRIVLPPSAVPLRILRNQSIVSGGLFYGFDFEEVK